MWPILLAAVLAVSLPHSADAQQVDGADGITLEQVVHAALRYHPAVERAQYQLESSRGEVMTASGRYATRVSASVGGLRESRFASDPEVGGFVSTDASYSLETQTLTRLGITLQPAVSVQRFASPLVPEPQSNAAVSLMVSAPLLRDRFGRATRSAERTAEVLHGADVLGLEHASESAVLDAVIAYWGLLAAEERLAVQADAEARAEKLTEETRLLIAADERPRNDLNQLLGSLAVRRIARITAEQGVAEARQRLALATGSGASAMAAFGKPLTSFPTTVVAEAAAGANPDHITQLIEVALEERSDLGQARGRTRAADVMLDAVRDELLPQLNLSVSVGYRGASTGAGFEHLFTPLYHEIPGPNASLQIQYSFPISRDEARGRSLQRHAAREQSRIAQKEIERRVTTGVGLAAMALERGARNLREAAEAVALLAESVENERTKFQLGAATLFDILHSEDALTSAMLAEVSSKQAYAVALANLRFETGTLVSMDPDFVATVDIDPLLGLQ